MDEDTGEDDDISRHNLVPDKDSNLCDTNPGHNEQLRREILQAIGQFDRLQHAILLFRRGRELDGDDPLTFEEIAAELNADERIPGTDLNANKIRSLFNKADKILKVRLTPIMRRERQYW